MINRILNVSIALLATLAPATLLAQPYFFVGPSGGDFYDEANWNDAADGTGASLSLLGDVLLDDAANNFAVDLVIDGDSVVAAGQVDIGVGSITLEAGSQFEVSGSGHDLDVNPDSGFTMTDSTLIVDDFIQFGGTVSLTGSTVTASDDINFLDTITGSIIDTMVESTGDDVEFREGATLTTVQGSDFFASSLGSDGSFNQSVILQQSFTAVDSTFTGGQLGIDGPVETNITAIDSDFTFTGDMNSVFSSSSTGIHRVFLQGDSTLEADQIEEGILLALQDSSSATFIDDNDDDGDGTGESVNWIVTNALVRLDSRDASLTFMNVDGIDNLVDIRSRVFNGLLPTIYSIAPETFSPSDWDGVSAVTLQVVPEPMSAGLLAAACGLCLASRRKSSWPCRPALG